jgi:drug/metabolite transporter (DMT)-like permease
MPSRDNLRGISSMLLAVPSFAFMDAGLKLLSQHYPAMQVAALRAMASLPLVYAYVAWRGAIPSLWRVRWRWHLLRGVLGIGMLSLFAFGLRHLPMAEAYSISFVAPILITALSVPVLGEEVDAGRWIAVFVGLAGVLVVLRPSGAGMMSIGGLAILGAAFCYAVSAIVVRLVNKTDSSESLVFWLMTFVAVGAGAMAAPNWTDVRLQDGWILLGVAVFGFFGQLTLTEAFRHGQASVIAPFEYTALAWALALDWLLWRATPDRITLLGAAIIIASGIYLVRRERVHVESEHP